MKGREEVPRAPKRGCRGGGCPAEPSTPASTAFPSSLDGFCHDSAWPRVIYSSLGTESKVLERIPQILVSAVHPLPKVFPAVGGQDRLEELLALHTLLPAHPTACPAPSPTRVAGEQSPPKAKSCSTLQEWATGAGQAKDSHEVSPGTPEHPSPVPDQGCVYIRQSQRLLGFPKYLHQHHPLQWGDHKLGELAETCQAHRTWGAAGAQPPLSPHPPQPHNLAEGAQKGLSGHGMVLWDPGTLTQPHPCPLHGPGPSPSPALPGPCTGQGLSPDCLFPQLWGHRASWRQGSTPLTPRKVRGFPGSEKKNRNWQWATAARRTPMWSCSAVEPMGPGPQNSHLCPHFLRLSVLQGPAAREGLFLEKPGCFPGTLLLYRDKQTRTQLSHIPRHRTAPVLPDQHHFRFIPVLGFPV